MPVVKSDRPSRANALSEITRNDLVDLCSIPGSAVLEGWSDKGVWSIALPWPEEVVELPWRKASEWVELVRTVESRRSREAPDLVDGWEGSSLPPFLGGWVGFLSYDAGAITEGAMPPVHPPVEPAAWFARHDSGVVMDPAGIPRFFGPRRTVNRPLSRHRIQTSCASAQPLEDSMGDGRFGAGVDRIRSLIRDGEVYQVNLTRRLQVTGDLDPADVYRRMIAPATPRCSALIRGSGWTIASASPEVLLEADRRRGIADSRPIKGTIRRAGRDAEEVATLLGSAKDASEHLMIVDLVRNDLGRIAPPGCVEVAAYRTVRTLPYAHHLESTVRAKGLEGQSVADILAVVFPGGSITGAPKRSAVRTIRDMEGCARGVYTGAIGYIGDDGRSAFSVAIRTAVAGGGRVRYHAGGGIVWDSDPAAEDAEAMTKAEPFLRAIRWMQG